MIRKLEGEYPLYAALFAALVAASASNAAGDKSAAKTSLRKAIDLADQAHMAMYAAAARYQLGLLLGDDEGRTLVQQAEDAMRAQDVKAPSRFVQIWLPGSWSAG